jgi:hypothetical protein
VLVYPETAGGSLEEIDSIFAKGYCEKIIFVKASHELPRLTDEEIEQKAIEYGFADAGPADPEEGTASPGSEEEQRENRV